MKALMIMLAAVVAAPAMAQGADDALDVLYLSRSAGFEHSVVKVEGDAPSHTDRILTQLSDEMGANITVTKDAGAINAENLANYDVVVFYTTGDLTAEGGDQGGVMGPEGFDELQEWIRNGGGFVAFHSATDTFRAAEGAPATPYTQMVGAEFQTHGAQFVGELDVVDPGHPTMKHVKDGWQIMDEWYLYRNINEDMRVLALLDPGAEREKQPDHYDVPSYPMIWVRTEGDGRIYHNGMGHREDVWENKQFQEVVKDALRWAAGEGPAMAETNYEEAVAMGAVE